MTQQTIIAHFDGRSDAQQAAEALTEAGISRSAIRVPEAETTAINARDQRSSYDRTRGRGWLLVLSQRLLPAGRGSLLLRGGDEPRRRDPCGQYGRGSGRTCGGALWSAMAPSIWRSVRTLGAARAGPATRRARRVQRAPARRQRIRIATDVTADPRSTTMTRRSRSSRSSCGSASVRSKAAGCGSAPTWSRRLWRSRSPCARSTSMSSAGPSTAR